jgi:hypothetical protein
MDDVEAFLERVQRARRTLVAGATLTALATAWTLVVPVVGGAGLSVLTSGSRFTAGMRLWQGIPEAWATAMVGAGSLVVSLPLAFLLLGGSAVWHLRVRRALREVGIPRPALGILAPARLVAVPTLVGVALTALVAPVPFLLGPPPPGDLMAAAVRGMAWMAPLLGPLLGLWIGWRRGIDGRLTARLRAGGLTRDDLGEDARAFPLVRRWPRAVLRAELLRRDGALTEADAVLRAYLERVGVSPGRALRTWARVRRDRGDRSGAEACARAAAWLVPVDRDALDLLAELRRAAGAPDEAERIEAEAEAIHQASFGLVPREPPLPGAPAGGRLEAPAS